MDENTQLAMALSISMLDSNEQQNVVPDAPLNQPLGKTKKKGRRKKKTDEDLDEQTRIAMAISASLADEKRKKNRELGRDDGPDDGVNKKTKAKGRRKRAPKKNCQEFPVLLTRQDDERQKIWQERINAIIASSLDEYDCSLPVLHPSRIDSKYSALDQHHLGDIDTDSVKVKSGANLWNAAGLEQATCSEQTGNLSCFYVKQLQSTITPQEPKLVTTPYKRVVSMTPGKMIKMTPRKTPRKVSGIQAETSMNATCADDTSALSTTQAMGMTIQCLADLAEEGLEAPELSPFGDSSMTGPSGFIPQEAEERTESPESRFNEDQLSLLEDLSSLVNTSTMSDVLIEIDDGSRLHAHSFMIQLRCPALATVLAETSSRNNAKLPVLRVKDISYESMESVLSYIYSAQLTITAETAAEILLFASRYDLPDLVSHCKLLLPDSPEPAKQRKSSQRSDLDIVNKDLNQLIDSLWEDEQDEENERDNNGREAGDSSSDDDKERECLDDEEIDEIYEMALTQRSRKQSEEMEYKPEMRGHVERADEGTADVSEDDNESHDERVTIVDGGKRAESSEDDVEMKSESPSEGISEREHRVGTSHGQNGVGQNFRTGGEDGASQSDETDEEMSRTILTQGVRRSSLSDDEEANADEVEDWTMVLDDDFPENDMDVDVNTLGRCSDDKENKTHTAAFEAEASPRLQKSEDKCYHDVNTNNSDYLVDFERLRSGSVNVAELRNNHTRGKKDPYHNIDTSLSKTSPYKDSERIPENCRSRSNAPCIPPSNIEKSHKVGEQFVNMSNSPRYPLKLGCQSTADEEEDEVLLLQCDSTDAESPSCDRTHSAGMQGNKMQETEYDLLNHADDEESETGGVGRKKLNTSKRRRSFSRRKSEEDCFLVQEAQEHPSEDLSSSSGAARSLTTPSEYSSMSVDFPLAPRVILHKARLPKDWDHRRSVEDNLEIMTEVEGDVPALPDRHAARAEGEQLRQADIPSMQSFSDSIRVEHANVSHDDSSGKLTERCESIEDDFSDDILSPSPPPSPKFSRASQVSRLENASQNKSCPSQYSLENTTFEGQKKRWFLPLSKSLTHSPQEPDSYRLSHSSSGENVMPLSFISQNRNASLERTKANNCLNKSKSSSPQVLAERLSISVETPNEEGCNSDVSSPVQLSPVFPLPSSLMRTPGASSTVFSPHHDTSTNVPSHDGIGDERFAFDMEEGCGFDDFNYLMDDDNDFDNGEVENERDEEGRRRGNKDEDQEEIDLTHDESDAGQEDDHSDDARDSRVRKSDRPERCEAEERIDLTQSEDDEEYEKAETSVKGKKDGKGPGIQDDRHGGASEMDIQDTAPEDDQASTSQQNYYHGEARCSPCESPAVETGVDDLEFHHDNMSDSFLLQHLVTPTSSLSAKAPVLRTPAFRRLQQDEYYSPAPITPMPDYSSMLTPDLKKELKRYGVKPLGKKKAKLLLSEIFSYLHQILPEDMCDEESQTDPNMQKEAEDQTKTKTKRGKTESKGKKAAAKQSTVKSRDRSTKDKPSKDNVTGNERSSKPVKRKKAVWDLDDTPTKRVRIGSQSEEGAAMGPPTKGSGVRRVEEGKSKAGASGTRGPEMNGGDEFSCSQESHDSSYDSTGDDFGESIYHEDESGADSEVMASQQVRDMPTEITKYIQSNKALHLKILNYEVLNLETLYNELKDNKIPCSKIKLMEYLDSRCITFSNKDGSSRQRKPKNPKPKRLKKMSTSAK